MNDADAGVFCRKRHLEHDSLAVQIDLALVRLINTGKDLDQSTFARAIFAEQSDDLALFDIDIDVVQRTDTGEAFADPSCFHHIFSQTEYLHRDIGSIPQRMCRPEYCFRRHNVRCGMVLDCTAASGRKAGPRDRVSRPDPRDSCWCRRPQPGCPRRSQASRRD